MNPDPQQATAIDGCVAWQPRQMKRRVKADRLTPAYLSKGALPEKTDRRRGSGFRASSHSAASPSQAKLCPFGSQKPPSDVHQFSR